MNIDKALPLQNDINSLPRTKRVVSAFEVDVLLLMCDCAIITFKHALLS